MSPSFEGGHALLIGVGADLPFTIDDASCMANILKDPERCAYPADQIELLVGEKAYKQAILDALDHLADVADESSTVLIYFSGHGYRAINTIGEAYFLMPFGAEVEDLKSTAIKGSEFASLLEAVRSKKLLLLLDCCHAGGLDFPKGVEAVKSPLPPEALEVLRHGKGRVIIASCKDNELSYGGKPYSAFTQALIEAFSGYGAQKHDGFVRAADLAMYASDKVTRRTGERQHPVLHFEEADNFEIAYYAGGGVQPKGLPFREEAEIEPEPGAWNVFSGRFSGPVSAGGDAVDARGSTGAIVKTTGNIRQHIGDHIEFHGDIISPPKIPNGSEHRLRLDKINEWKKMHTEMHILLNILTPIIYHLDQCHITLNSDEKLKDAEKDWLTCALLLTKLKRTISDFHYISSEETIVICLDHANSSTTISHLISKAKTINDADRVGETIRNVRRDFEETLIIADTSIVDLIDDFTKGIAGYL